MKPNRGTFGKKVLAGVFLSITSWCSAAILLGDPVGASPFGAGTTVGLSFTVDTSPLLVTSLGVYDNGQDGLNSSHLVGLWDNGGTLLVSTTVSTTDPLSGAYRYAAITPQILSAGATYYLGALFPGTSGPADRVGNGGTATLGSGIVSADTTLYDNSGSMGGTVLTRPDDNDPFFGDLWAANMEYSVVPEPVHTALAMAAGLVLVVLVNLRRRRAGAPRSY